MMEEEYLSEYKGHRIYFTKTGKLHTAHSVIFIDGKRKDDFVTDADKKEAYKMLLSRIDNIPAYHSMYKEEQ